MIDQQFEAFIDSSGAQTRCNRGIRREFQTLDVAVWKWTLGELKKQGTYPPKKVIQSFALNLYRDAGHENFKASAGWYHGWRRRYDLKRMKARKVKHSNLTEELQTHEKTEYKFSKFKSNSCDNIVYPIDEQSAAQIAGVRYSVRTNDQFSWKADEELVKNLNNSDEIRKGEADFIEWLRENEKHNNNVSKLDVIEKIKSLFKPSWSQEKHWFVQYCKRRLKGEESSVKKIIYSSADFRKLLVNYAGRTSKVKAATVFNIARKQLFNWMKNDDEINRVAKEKSNAKLVEWCKSQKSKPTGYEIRKKAKAIFGSDSKYHFSYSWYYKWCAKNGIAVINSYDEKVVEWILLAYDLNLNVSHHDVRKKALEIYREEGKEEFKASSGWFLRFCRRYMNLIRWVPPISVHLPPSYETKVLNFRDEISHFIYDNGIQPQYLGVMDEIPLKIKPSASIKRNAQREPLLRSCSFNNVPASIILCCLATGTLLPAVIVLKDKITSTSCVDYHVLFCPDELLDDNVILYWLENVWFRNVEQPNLLFVDCFPIHTSEHIGEKLKSRGSFLKVIPGGCSSKLNPLTQIISPQLKDIVDDYCKKWYHENQVSWLEGNISLSSNDILKWIKNAFEHVKVNFSKDDIRNVFEEMKLISKI